MQLTEQEKTQLNDWIDELNDYKTKIAHFESDANVAIGNMNEYIQKYNNVLKNVDAFATQITGRFELAQQEKPALGTRAKRDRSTRRPTPNGKLSTYFRSTLWRKSTSRI